MDLDPCRIFRSALARRPRGVWQRRERALGNWKVVEQFVAVFSAASVKSVVLLCWALLIWPLLSTSTASAQQFEIKPVAEKKIEQLPQGPLFWRIDNFPTLAEAHAAAGPTALAAEVAGKVWLFTLGRGLNSLNLGNSGLMMTTLHESAPAARLGFAFGVVNGAGPLGAFIGPLVGGPLVDRYGFNVVLAIDAALLAGVVLGLTFGYRDAFVPSRERPPILRAAFEGLQIIWASPRLRALFPALLVVFAGWLLFVLVVVCTINYADRSVVAAVAATVVAAGGGDVGRWVPGV